MVPQILRAGLKACTPTALQPAHDAPAPAVHRRQLQLHPVADNHAHEIAIDPIGHVRDHLRSLVQPHAVEAARELLDHHARYRRALTGTSRAVSIHGSPDVTATVCSKCADRLVSRVIAVHPSASTFTAGFPAFTMGSIASTMPSVSRGSCPGSP